MSDNTSDFILDTFRLIPSTLSVRSVIISHSTSLWVSTSFGQMRPVELTGRQDSMHWRPTVVPAKDSTNTPNVAYNKDMLRTASECVEQDERHKTHLLYTKWSTPGQLVDEMKVSI